MNNITEIAVQLLRELKSRDPEAFEQMIAHRVAVNEEVGKHPSLIVGSAKGKSQMGLLNTLNSILQASGNSRIATVVDNDQIIDFTVVPNKSAKP